MNSEPAKTPAVPVYNYTTRRRRTGLTRRLGFDSVADVSKNRTKIVNEQKQKLNIGNRFPRDEHSHHRNTRFGHSNNRGKEQGKSLRNRKITVDKSWKVQPLNVANKKKVIKKKRVEKPKSLEDLDKEMESYFNENTTPKQVEGKTAEELDKEMDAYMGKN